MTEISIGRALDENIIVTLVQRGITTETFRRLDHDKKYRIYRAALRLFGKYGYDGLSIDQFCHDAGISKGSFFQYFPSKSHLLEFTILLFDNYLSTLFEEIKRTAPGPMVRQRLIHLYEELVINSRLYRIEEQFYLFATRAIYHSAILLEGIDLERHLTNYVIEIIKRGEEIGEIRGDFDYELTGHLVAMIISALVGKTYLGKKLPHRQTREYLISFLFDGIKA